MFRWGAGASTGLNSVNSVSWQLVGEEDFDFVNYSKDPIQIIEKPVPFIVDNTQYIVIVGIVIVLLVNLFFWRKKK